MGSVGSGSSGLSQPCNTSVGCQLLFARKGRLSPERRLFSPLSSPEPERFLASINVLLVLKCSMERSKFKSNVVYGKEGGK